jgi:DNA replication protein DnaC
MDQMKRLSELAAKMAATTSVENTTNSLSPDDEALAPVNVACFDPEHPDRPCPICRGMGVIKYAVATDDPRFGKLFRCPNNPLEVDEQRQTRLRRLSNLETYKNKTLANFRFDIPMYTPFAMESLKVAFAKAAKYAEDPEGWLIFEGAYGTGKTHLAAAIGNERLKRGDNVLFMTTPDLLDHLRGTYAPNSDMAYDELFNRVKNIDLLILDDIGTENPSDWAREKLFQILNHRYSNQLPTVITTNENIDNFDPRIRSRMMENSRVIINAPDFRNEIKNQKDIVLSHLARYSHMTFDSFDVGHEDDSDYDNLLKAAQAAADFANNPRGQQVWLFITGDYGTGKTHLAAAIANYRSSVGENVMFITVPDLLDYLRTAFDPKADMTFDKLFNQVRTVPILVLDDLGTESTKPWAQEKLFQILDHRYISRLPTVMTSAKPPSELPDRLASRLIDNRICRGFKITASSYAKRLKRR